MLMILIALVVLAVLSCFALQWAGQTRSSLDFVGFIFGLIGMSAAVIGLCIYLMSAWLYFSAEYKADIINREYGTSYTQQEVFWASGVIDTIRELDRKRVELNGDLITGDRARKEQEQ